MKDYWPSPAGRTAEFEDFGRVSVLSALLLPFFVVLLTASQVVDVGRYVLNRARELKDKINMDIAAKIDSLPYSLRTKYVLMETVAWLPTAALALVLAWNISDVMLEYKLKQERLAAAHAGNNIVIPDMRFINDSWPVELLAASDEAVIRINEDALMELAASFGQLSSKDVSELSQAEMINFALLHYYFGDEMQYQNKLEAARAMDPNERIFAK